MRNNSPGGASRRRRFAVTVDGVRHEVIVEELERPESAPPASAPAAASDGADKTDSPAPAASRASGPAGDGWMTAPMPGTVTRLNVKPGDTVAADDVVLVLTAMKLENEIRAPGTGTVTEIAIAEGDNVNNGDRLLQLEAKGADR